MKSKYLHIAFAALVLALSCTKEQEGAEPVVRGDYDPVVRFGLETYLDFSEPATKTAYAGDNKTILLNNVRYERIDWDVTADPDVDVVQILSEQDFTKYGNKNVADYKAKEIVGVTNNSTTKEDVADTEPYDGDVKKAFYWSAIKEDRYFYAVYPSPNTICVPNSKAKNFAIKSASTHTATVEGEIPGNQPYKGIKTTGTPGLSGSPASIEYLPDMTNAYMYAAAKVDKADAGYDKVPLRFKPLFSAVKLIVTARDAGAKNYRLKKVELRTDLHYDDVYLRPNNPNGTALGGKFKASFGLASGGKTTGDFTVDPLNDADTLQRLTIDIPEGQRYLLNEDTLKVTFLALPVEQQYLVVDYTFEYQDAGGAWKDVRRILALQDRKKIFKTGDKDSWYKLEKAHKLYVRSGVPEIEYHFKVQSQSFLPRVWRNDCLKTTDDIPSGVSSSVDPNAFLAQDFYSVVSYRDSSGVLQPLKWQVTGYSDNVTGPFTATKPDWLFLRGEDGSYNPANDKAVFFDPSQPDYASNGINATGDPWAKAWGYGSHMDDLRKKYNNGFFCGYEGFEKNHSGVFFNAGGTNNGTALKDWLVDENQLITYNYCDPDGNYYYTEDRGTHKEGEAYAYDLSSHDIYGNLYPLKKNGDLVTTANCYVVSAPGWYRFPAVYGNAFKNGNPNPDAYTGKDGPNLLHAFLDCNNADITQPWIPGINKGNNGRDGVSLVWEDATDMIYATGFADSNRAEELEPFYWEDPVTGNGYIYFFVNQIAWSNAVIAAKSDDGNGTTVWSWHIWCVPDPRNTLKEIAIEPNETFGGGTSTSTAATAINAPEYWVRYSTVRAGSPGNFQKGDPFVYKSKHYADTKVWKFYDLGQGDEEANSYAYKRCYVEFTQYWRGKAIAKRVVCMAQSGVEDTSGLADVPFYQWGRKDPLPTSGESVYADLTQVTSTSTIGATIQHPATLYYGSSSYAPSGTSRYDNLWSTAVDYTTDTFLKFDTDGTKPGGRKDSPVVKTIYDPCPPGYSMPNLFAFTAFNPLGLFQTKISLNRIAYNHSATYGFGYHDLSTKYDGEATFRRDISEANYNAGEFVRFYFRGRRNGNPGSTVGSIDQKNTGHYWLAEPASNNRKDNTGTWSYGSVFIFQGQSGNSQSQVYPVAGGQDIDNTKTPPVAVSSPKWQRTHACSVRPMKEQ